MIDFKDYSDSLKGTHSFLSPSNYHWVNYDISKLKATYKKRMATERGTQLHALAEQCIRLGIRLPSNKTALNMFVNDAIGFKMRTEQVLFYSENAFGTTDAISFRDNILRIHDLKTGESTVSMKQLEIYVALFCLEYGIKIKNINVELRIYQGGEIIVYKPSDHDIQKLMATIVTFSKEIDSIKAELED